MFEILIYLYVDLSEAMSLNITSDMGVLITWILNKNILA